MLSLIIAFFSSFVATLLIIRFNHFHIHISADAELSSPQKVHKKIVPRIGGASIAFGIFLAILVNLKNSASPSTAIHLFLSAIPTFTIGITEDLTKKISVRNRLIFTAISSSLIVYLLGVQIIGVGIPAFDFLLAIPFIGALFTVFAMTGLANAYNIIDGFHGLSSMVGIITLIAIAYISFAVGDTSIIYLSLIMAAAILGFFIWNYPCGLIFLGDGGAYLIGFWIAALSVLLTFRHQEISPWFALLINGYPICETLFSIYRKIYQGKSPGTPDGIHLHALLYRRVLMNNHDDKNLFSANARTAPYFWILASLSITPAVIWWKSTPILIAATFAFAIIYIWLYVGLLKFKTPKWLRID